MQADRLKDRQKDRQIDRQTETHTSTLTQKQSHTHTHTRTHTPGHTDYTSQSHCNLKRILNFLNAFVCSYNTPTESIVYRENSNKN